MPGVTNLKGNFLHLLYKEEQFWVESQPFLLAQGYQLRPRYHPDWVPSWVVEGKTAGQFEDGLDLLWVPALYLPLKLKLTNSFFSDPLLTPHGFMMATKSF
jgi:hypothetical protein